MVEAEIQRKKLTREGRNELLKAEHALSELIFRSVGDLIDALTAEGGVDLTAVRDADDRLELCRRIDRNLFQPVSHQLESSEHE